MYQWIHLSPLTTPAPFLLSPTSHYFDPKNSSRLDPIGSNTQNAMRRWPRKKRNIFKRAMDMRGDMTVQADTRENVSVQAPCHCHSSSVRLLLLLTDPSCGIYNHPANTAPTSFHKTAVSTLSKSQLWPSPPKSQAALPVLSHNANERGEVRRWLGSGEYLRQLEVEKVQKSKHEVSA